MSSEGPEANGLPKQGAYGTAVSIQGLCKTYSIPTVQDRPTLFSEALKARARRPFHRIPRHDFKALADVSAEIGRGEAVGIIGRNGAGKSTLLKILSRVTAPTAGRVELYGRVGSLLEVGTGFHPELTGRENVYLNGAILGMRRAQITKAFDSIVEFAQVEEFLETPVKRYSSGMYVRLAFAVAAHLEPEILVVDEVLAVGDAEFQRRCLGKMREVSAAEGRTVLFVSHNMTSVGFFCPRVIYLKEGRVEFDGEAGDAIGRYLAQVGNAKEDDSGLFDLSDRDRSGSSPVLRRVEVRRLDGTLTSRLPMGEGMELRIHVQGLKLPEHFMAVGLVTETDLRVIQVNTLIKPLQFIDRAAGQTMAVLRIPSLPLNPGRYWIDLRVSEGGVVAGKRTVDRVERGAFIDVEPADVYGSGYEPPAGPGGAVCLVDFSWELHDRDLVVARTQPGHR